MSTPVLSRVIYDLFESDAAELDKPGSDAEHTIDRQIRLELSDGGIRHISWSSEPVQYCIGVQEESFFLPGNAITRDVSSHPLWCLLVGHAVALLVLDTDHQILEIRSPLGSVFLSSHERGSWRADVVTVSGSKPVAGDSDVVPFA